MYKAGTVTVLVEETKEKLGIDVSTLGIDSHERVIVKCNKCGEEFFREHRLVNRTHSCSNIVTLRNGDVVKWCYQCDKYILADKFDGEICQLCCEGNERYYLSHVPTATNLDDWVWQKRDECNKNGVNFCISVADIEKLWKIQDGLCYYSRIPLDFVLDGPNAAALDIIDRDKGYVLGNVVWCANVMKRARGDYSVQEFIKYLSVSGDDVYNNLVRIEAKKLNDDGKLVSRKRITDAGYDIYSSIDIVIPAHGSAMVDTGMAIACPPGYYMTIEGRSGLGMNDIVPFRGIIDSCYCGQLKVKLFNHSTSDYNVEKGHRIAQLIVHRAIHCDFTMIDEFGPLYNQRGIAGFGSSGN